MVTEYFAGGPCRGEVQHDEWTEQCRAMPGSPHIQGCPNREGSTLPNLFPAATGPTVVVSTELKKYVGFPSGTECQDGSLLIGYQQADSHWDSTIKSAFRRSYDGITWSDEWSPSTGNDMGFCGMATETEAQGGRTHLLQVKEVFAPGTQSVTSIQPYYRWSDDNGANWSVPASLPGGGTKGTQAGAVQTWTFFPTSVCVLEDGTLLIAGYGGSNNHVLVRRSIDRGLTWVLDGDIAPSPGRSLIEPQLCAMADGRVAMAMRSDANGTEWMYMAIRRADGTWGPAGVINYDASGAPACREIAPGWLGIIYRGWTDRKDPTYRPMRVAAMTVDAGWGRSGGDVTPGETGRFLYGVILKPAGGDERDYVIVHGVEGPNGPTSPACQIRATPVHFAPVPAKP